MPFRILLTEDNPDHAMLISELLVEDDDDIEVQHVSTGQSALDALERAKLREAPMPDLIILDLNMPGMDGVEVLKRIKAERVLRGIPAVILSSSQARTDVTIAMREHANSYAVKSTDIDLLERDIRSIRHYWRQTQVRAENTD